MFGKAHSLPSRDGLPALGNSTRRAPQVAAVIHAHRRVLINLMRWGVSGALLAWLLSKADLDRLIDVFANADPWLLFAAFLVLAPTRLLAAERWRILLKGNGFSVRYIEVLELILTSMSFSLILPGGMATMDAYRTWFLSKYHGRTSEVLATVMMDRALGIYALVLMAFVAAMAMGSRLSGDVDWRMITGVILALATVGFLVGGKYGHTMASWVVRRARLLRRLRDPLDRFGEALQPGRIFSRLGLWVFMISLLVHVARAITIWLIFSSMTDAPSLGLFLVYVPVMFVVLLLPISVGGLGVRESVLFYLLAPHGVSAEVAVAAGVTSHAMSLALGIPGIFLWMFRRDQLVAYDGEPAGEGED